MIMSQFVLLGLIGFDFVYFDSCNDLIRLLNNEIVSYWKDRARNLNKNE